MGDDTSCNIIANGVLYGNEEDNCSSQSGCYKPGFKINYSWENSSLSSSSSKKATKKHCRPTVVDPAVVKDRCRVAYTNSGNSYAVEGHGKMYK